MKKKIVLLGDDENLVNVAFQINSAKFYVSVVTISRYNNITFLEYCNQVFKKTIFWNKYRSDLTSQPKNNNLDYMIDPTFKNINRLFVISFKNGGNDPTRNYFLKFYIPLLEIKDFNALIGKKKIFYQTVKNK